MTTLLTIPQAAERLGCSRWSVYELIKRGAIRRYSDSFKADRKPHWRVSAEDVEAYIASIEVPLPAHSRDSAA